MRYSLEKRLDRRMGQAKKFGYGKVQSWKAGCAPPWWLHSKHFFWFIRPPHPGEYSSHSLHTGPGPVTHMVPPIWLYSAGMYSPAQRKMAGLSLRGVHRKACHALNEGKCYPHLIAIMSSKLQHFNNFIFGTMASHHNREMEVYVDQWNQHCSFEGK